MLSELVGQGIRSYRESASLTREQVAGLCRAAGWPEITSTVLHYLETGRPDAAGRRRREITIDEMVALAYVLGVPPIALLAPLGEKHWPGLPQRLLTTTTAIAWLRGERRPDAELGKDLRPMPQAGSAPVYGQLRHYVRADALAQDLRQLLTEHVPAVAENADQGAADHVEAWPPGWQARFDAKLGDLRTARQQVRDAGHTPPALPLGLEWVDAGQAGDHHV